MSNKSFDPPLMLRLKFFVGAFVFNRCIRSDGTINRRLLNLLDRRIPPSAASTISTSDITVDTSRDLWFRLYVPSTTAKLPLLLYFHGGGFSCLHPDSKPCDDLCRALADQIPAAVASVNYRLAPEHKFPCQYDDGFDALKLLNAKAYDVVPRNVDLGHCFLAGDSAGANIAHHVAVRAARARQLFDKLTVAGIVAVQPFFGGEERTEAEVRLAEAPLLTADGADALWRMVLPEGADRDHAAANVVGGGGEEIESVEFPRALVVVGGMDPLQDWQRRYVKWLEKCGKKVELVEYDCNTFHGFYNFQELPQFQLLLQDVRRFINMHE